MAEDHIRYDILAQEALRGVMRKVLIEVARTGLPGNHHFFITFLTGAPGVRISSRLKERYPEQMTIVVQFQYWDLKVTDTGFEVGLSFSDVPEKLEIPFAAVRGFYDPSVNFELEFDVKPVEPAAAPVEPTPMLKAVDNNPPAEPKPLPVKAPKPEKTKKAQEPAPSEPTEDKSEDEAPKAGADVVSLDAFRKK
ncbi:SspB family protein [Tianweitania sp.]|uniref:SspB family protein n=1 Tax=Tianweitania sp. TaxID=2021634 RepID=UPI00289D0338|nr:SspB family protein [Tianweitania sp.]